MKDLLQDKIDYATLEMGAIEPKDVNCNYCMDTGIVEIMGGSDADEWGVVDEKACSCGQSPYRKIL
jgi:hypothetical protein